LIEFATEHKIPHAYGTYEELVNDEKVDIVYVGTLHPTHVELAKLALQHGKHVLVEKPFTMNEAEAREVAQLAKQKKLFCMEALWTRFLPLIHKLVEIIKSGEIGTVRNVQVDLGFNKPKESNLRLYDKKSGGGGLLDLGVYLWTLSTLCLGSDPISISTHSTLSEDEKVDISGTIRLAYEDGKQATLVYSFIAKIPCELIVTGSLGSIRTVGVCHSPTALKIKNFIDGSERDELSSWPAYDPKVYAFRHRNALGLAHQAFHVQSCLEQGLTESPLYPLDETIKMMTAIDLMRKQVGVSYDCDNVSK